MENNDHNRNSRGAKLIPTIIPEAQRLKRSIQIAQKLLLVQQEEMILHNEETGSK
jgi:hypothetical protein